MPLDTLLPLAIPAAVVLATLFWYRRRRREFDRAMSTDPGPSPTTEPVKIEPALVPRFESAPRSPVAQPVLPTPQPRAVPPLPVFAPLADEPADDDSDTTRVIPVPMLEMLRDVPSEVHGTLGVEDTYEEEQPDEEWQVDVDEESPAPAPTQASSPDLAASEVTPGPFTPPIVTPRVAAPVAEERPAAPRLVVPALPRPGVKRPGSLPDIAPSVVRGSGPDIAPPAGRGSRPEIVTPAGRGSRPDVAPSIARGSRPDITPPAARGSRPDVAPSIARGSRPDIAPPVARGSRPGGARVDEPVLEFDLIAPVPEGPPAAQPGATPLPMVPPVVPATPPTPRPSPVEPDAAATPVPAPIAVAPAPDPTPPLAVEAPAPSPVAEAPAPSPVVEAPAPPPVVEAPAPPPVVEAPAPPPVVEAPAAPPPAAALPPAASRLRSYPQTEFEKNDPRHQAARRFARLAVSEIVLYHEPEVVLGRTQRDLWGRLRTDIELCVTTYEKRVPKEVRDQFDYLYDEFVRQLAQGDPAKLGPGAPAPPSK